MSDIFIQETIWSAAEINLMKRVSSNECSEKRHCYNNIVRKEAERPAVTEDKISRNTCIYR